jgi:phosphonate degradation associated HDIG domain protein
MGIADEVLSLFQKRGTSAYFGEHVSMTEHSLQAAYFGREEAAPRSLVLAALLHDIGHLVEDVPDELSDWTADAHHEQTGADWLAERFRPEVWEPVRLHVAAKRYLCATDPSYVSMLSQASIVTLELQGGALTPKEVLQFETHRGFREAVRLRRWDDQGKVAGLKTPGLAEYRGLIEEYALPPTV